ncbi:hypothetical protein [Paenibacillus cymbidii]|uniref:hypothetical protein n=1 Tax=Paenibacillus cymbidii TaxID=1639034 RepID=UPI0010806784|nr:hypothetical protein [Paenibacillus cymbidii]
MTLIIAKKNVNYVTIASDTKRCTLSLDNGIEKEESNIRKTYLLTPTILIASAGMAAEHSIDTIKAIIASKKEVSKDDLLNCCIDVYKSHHALFRKYNPTICPTTQFILAGKYPGTTAPFLILCNSNLEFTPENKEEVIIGESATRAKTIFDEKLTGEDMESVLLASALTIKEVSENARLVGETSVLTYIDPHNNVREAWVSMNRQEYTYVASELHRKAF